VPTDKLQNRYNKFYNHLLMHFFAKCMHNIVQLHRNISQNNIQQKILLDCDQSNVLLSCIIFFCILLRAFSFLLACIRDPVSNWDPFNIIPIVTGVKVVIGHSLPKFIKYCPILGTEKKKIQIMVDDSSCHLSYYTSCVGTNRIHGKKCMISRQIF